MPCNLWLFKAHWVVLIFIVVVVYLGCESNPGRKSNLTSFLEILQSKKLDDLSVRGFGNWQCCGFKSSESIFDPRLLIKFKLIPKQKKQILKLKIMKKSIAISK